jgi:transcription elongation factor SPT6
LLAEKYFTAEDDKIRMTDVPERLQLRFATIEPPSGEEAALSKEAEWIFTRAFQHQPADQGPAVIPKIISVLRFLRKDNLEIPFIASYRKDDWASHLEAADLWRIYEWDEKFVHLLTRKANLRLMYQQVPDLEEEFYNLLEQSQTEQEVKDLYDHFQLHYHETVEVHSSSRYKRPVKRNFYHACEKAGVVGFANKVAVNGCCNLVLTGYIAFWTHSTAVRQQSDGHLPNHRTDRSRI